MTDKLLMLQKFLNEDLGLDSRFHNDKLYLLDNKGKFSEIVEKCDELSIRYIRIRNEPIYTPIDPILLKREICGFKQQYEYFEEIEELER